MTERSCPECGALYPDEVVSCEGRFHALLALDHSRQEPWGSRHGQAFAAFALQHPTAYPTSLDAAWSALYRIYRFGERAADVFSAIRRNGSAYENLKVPVRPATPTAHPRVTIMDLGDFAASTYATQLDAWCGATLASWGADIDEPAP